MPYTNTQHLSNTRTTVTIVLSIIFGVSIIPTTAKETSLYFNLENSAVPTLYQEVRVTFRRGRSPDIELKAEDQFYFIETASVCDVNPICTEGTKQCTVTTAKVGVTLWTVEQRKLQDYPGATVIIKNTEFTVNNEYKICYLKKGADSGASKVREASYILRDGQRTHVPFTILSSIYTAHEINPTIVYAGQGPVTLTITVAADTAKENKQVTQPAYLIPCTSDECPNTRVFTEVVKDKMGPLCSRTHKEGAVATDVIKGFGTNTLTTTFFAPLTPGSYIVCVPYCFRAGGCRDAVSWALVDSNTPIKILPPDPSSYTIDPSSPNTLKFTGTDLKKGDKIRILAAGQVAQGLLCPSSSATELPNTEYTTEVTTTSSPTIPTGDNTISFTINAKDAAAAIGQVCYSREGNPNLWAPVFQTAEKTALYFSLENADVPTLYQEVRVKIRKGSTEAVEPKFAEGDTFAEGDKFYFMETEERKKCEDSTEPVGVTLLTVNEVGTGGTYAVATVVIKNQEFTVGKTYKMCYITKGGRASPQAYEASATLTSEKDTPVSFTVLSSIYTTHVTTPPTVYAGQGPVTLTITNAPQEASGKAFGKKVIGKVPYLIPCRNECSANDKDIIAALCSKDIAGNQGSIRTGEFKGYSTNTLTITFSAPAAEVPTKSYMICVPYCFKTDNCQGNDISWALVNSNPPIKIFAANPLSYTIKRTSLATLTFTGSGLHKGDKIRILTADQATIGKLCIFSSGASLGTDYTAEADAYCPTGDTRSSVSKFTLAHSKVTALTRVTKGKGQVCYARADSPNVWAPVIQTEDKTALYFTLENADVPTLYQEVRVKVRKGPTVDDTQFVFKETDKFYFIETAENCIANPICVAALRPDGTQICKIDTKDVTLWSVRESSTFPMATVVIKSADFQKKKTYKMCYIKKDTGDSCGVVYEAKYSSTSATYQSGRFTVKTSIYTAPEMTPATVYAGQGPVTLTITVASEKGLVNKEMVQRPYLIPCTTEDCSRKIFSDVNEEKDRMASLCSKGSTGNANTVTTDKLTGYDTGTLTTTFFAPATPGSYGICVPYCFKPGNCDDSDVSWSIVDFDYPITFEPANPSSYTIDPNSPNTLTFKGNNLKVGDKIRIVSSEQVSQEKSTKGKLCLFSTAVSSQKSEYTEEITATSATGPVSKFTLLTQKAAEVTGQVCYSRAGNLLEKCVTPVKTNMTYGHQSSKPQGRQSVTRSSHQLFLLGSLFYPLHLR